MDLPWRGAAVERLRAWLANAPQPAGGEMDLDGDYVLHRRDGRLHVAVREAAAADWPALVWDWRREPALAIPALGVALRCVQPGPGSPSDDPCVAVWPRGGLPCPLTVRPRRPGDRVVPWGMAEPVRVKKVVGGSDLPPAARRAVFVVAAPDGTILWLPGLRRAANLPLTPEVEATIALIFESSQRPARPGCAPCRGRTGRRVSDATT
jgi:tRNA(Ile)-lysidine synthase